MPARFFRLRTASLSRKLAFLLLGVLLGSLMLTACGETPTATTITNTTTAASAPRTTAAGATTAVPAPGTTAATSSNAAVKLNKDVSGNVEFWHIWASPVRRNAIRRVVAVCQAQLPNIKVKETFKPFGDIWTANTAAVAAGSGMPDVIVEDRPKLALAAANNIQSSLQTTQAGRNQSGCNGYVVDCW
jgi:multiple sugar transport system substrate-binding protein